MRANIHDVKTHLSRYLEELGEGEVLTICKRNEPIAELRMLSKREPGQRPVGLDRRKFVLEETSGCVLVGAMQASPHKEVEPESSSHPAPVRDVSL